jgi:ribosomal protein L19
VQTSASKIQSGKLKKQPELKNGTKIILGLVRRYFEETRSQIKCFAGITLEISEQGSEN